MMYRPVEAYTKEIEDKPLVVVLPGITTNIRNSRALAEEVSKYKGVEGHVWNSIISGDRPQPDRFLKMADLIARAIRHGRETLLVGWSLGCAEAVQALLTLRANNKDFDQMDFKKLEMVLVSPVGAFAGISGMAKFFREDLSRLVASMDKESPYQTLDTLITFPPQNVSREAINVAVRMAYPDLSQLSGFENDTLPHVVQDTDRGYLHNVGEEDREKVTRLDREIAALLPLAGEENIERLKTVLKQRAGILYPYQQKLYAGDFFEHQDTEPQAFRLDLFAASLLGFSGSLGRLLFGQHPAVINQMIERGSRVRFLVPEFDAFVPILDLLHLYPDTEMTVIGGSTHTSIFPPQPSTALREAMKNLNHKSHQ